MSRSYLPKRSSEYTSPIFMNQVPKEAKKEAKRMAARFGKHTDNTESTESQTPQQNTPTLNEHSSSQSTP